MSRIEPLPPQPVEATARQRLTAAERQVILRRQGFRCVCCPQPLRLEVDGRLVLAAMVDEHIIPLELGGSNDLANRELRCVPCAKLKTRADRKAIAKALRIRRRLDGQERPKQKIRSRGFPRDPLSWKQA